MRFTFRDLSRACKILTLLLFGSSLFLPFSAGQEPPKPGDGATINGTATDQTQAVVPDAKATLTSAAGEKLELKSTPRASIPSPALSLAFTRSR